VSSPEAFRFLHAGDLHLDSPVEGLSAEAPPEVLAVLRGATSAAWVRVVDAAVERAVDFVVIAGDVFEVASPTLLGQTRFRDGLSRLADSGIRTYVVHGNHDPLDGRSWAPSLRFPAEVHRFGTDAGESMPFVRDGREIARIHGRSYPRSAVTENYAAGMRALPGSAFSIGLLHTNVGDRPGHHNYAPCSVEDLRSSGMNYWALGHIHQPGQVLADPPAYYCGIPQGRDPGELGERGCWLVEVDATGHVSPTFLPTDVIRWQPIELAIDDLADDEALRDTCRTAIERAMSDADGRSLVVRIRLSGRGPLHANLVRTGYLSDLRQLLNEERGVVPPLAWIESVRDATRPSIDVQARRDAPDFVGDFLRTVASARRSGRTTDPEEHERWQRMMRESVHALFEAAPRGRKYLARATPSDDALVGELLDQAETLGLDLLVGAEDDR